MRECGLRHEEHAVEVDLEDATPDGKIERAEVGAIMSGRRRWQTIK
jgi:hypothetical protein